MGWFIETERVTGEHFDKAKYLESVFGAVKIPAPSSFPALPEDKALVMVVANANFEAAGYIYDAQEFELAKPSAMDQRPREWLVMDKIIVERLTGFSSRRQK